VVTGRQHLLARIGHEHAGVFFVAVALAAALVGFFLGRRATHDQRLPPPATIESIGAELFYVDISAITHRGPGLLIALRFRRPVELIPRHFRSMAMLAPVPIGDWRARLNAPVVVNAGQFDQDLHHLGWLKADGEWVSQQYRPAWLGLLVSSPVLGTPWAGIIDLDESSPQIAQAYRHVVQSMMLVDDHGRVRVRDTDKAACRTAIAQDKDGRMLVLLTEGAVTLGDLARYLAKSDLHVVRAMNLDGGVESQVAIKTPELEMTFYGQFATGATGIEAGRGSQRPLPAVIEIRPAELVCR
jgi:hypothetical protein